MSIIHGRDSRVFISNNANGWDEVGMVGDLTIITSPHVETGTIIQLPNNRLLMNVETQMMLTSRPAEPTPRDPLDDWNMSVDIRLEPDRPKPVRGYILRE